MSGMTKTAGGARGGLEGVKLAGLLVATVVIAAVGLSGCGGDLTAMRSLVTSVRSRRDFLTVSTAMGLTIEEYAIVSADVAAPDRYEFFDHIPDSVLERRAAWRRYDAQSRVEKKDDPLAPFGCHLWEEDNPEGQGVSYGLTCDGQRIVSDLGRVWPVSVNAAGSAFALMAQRHPVDGGECLLVRNQEVEPLPREQCRGIRPIYWGDQLLRVERVDHGRFAVKQEDEILYVYTDPRVRPDPSPEELVFESYVEQVDPTIRGLLVTEEGWSLLAKGEVIINGESLNRRLGVDEIFTYISLHGQRLFFFEQGGKVGISYGGETLPLSYDEVIRYQGCEPGAFNVAWNSNMVWFYALKDGMWHYVEIGVYDED